MNKNILTLEQLHQFFVYNNANMHFDSKEHNQQIVVSIPANFELVDMEPTMYESNGEMVGMLQTKLQVCHINRNRNGSFISQENMEKAMPTLKYRPVLAYIHKLPSGIYDFYSHNFEINQDEEGNDYTEYLEKQVGCFTVDEPYLEYDKEKDKTYVIAHAVIPEGYTPAADIIRRKNGTKVSCELVIDELFYNAKDKQLELIDFYFGGCTLLGCDEDGVEINEGMEGSRLDIADFYYKDQHTDKLVETLDKIHEVLSSFKIKKSEEGGANMGLENTTPTTEDVIAIEENIEFNEDVQLGNSEFVDDGTTEVNTEPTTYSRTFEISHDDIRCGLYRLLDAEGMNCWISQVYNKYFIMDDWCKNKSYKQSYSVENDNITLVNDRVRVYQMYVTDEERTSIEEMRANYATLKQFKDDYDAAQIKAEKEAVFGRMEYSEIKNSREFIDLHTDMDKHSVTEIETKCDLMFAAYQKTKLRFESAKEDNPVRSVKLNIQVEPQKEIYAGLFND